MATQKNQPEKRPGGSKEQRDQHKPDKQRSDLNPDKERTPRRQSGRNS